MYQKTIRNNSKIIILFQQTLKDVEHIYRDIAGFDMSYDEFITSDMAPFSEDSEKNLRALTGKTTHTDQQRLLVLQYPEGRPQHERIFEPNGNP